MYHDAAMPIVRLWPFLCAIRALLCYVELTAFAELFDEIYLVDIPVLFRNGFGLPIIVPIILFLAYWSNRGFLRFWNMPYGSRPASAMRAMAGLNP